MLERILASRRGAVAELRSQVSLAEMKERACDSAPARAFSGKLRAPGQLAVIAEIKFRSPSAGQLRPHEPVAGIARSYESNGASAVSVLTEPEFFGGRLEFLDQAKQAAALPVLRKDFIFDPFQVYESRAAGADAILLIAAMLERNALTDLAALADELSMDVLVELHDEDDLEKAHDLPVAMFGVNHRSLQSLRVDLDISQRLFPLLPQQVVRVAESGIENAAQLALMRTRGADAVLVGTSLMRAPSPGDALAKLLGVPCGSSSAAL